MSNSIHFEQLFERFSRFFDREFSPAGESQPEKEGEGSMGEDSLLERVTTAAGSPFLALAR
jgi:hypothetical protein